MSLSSSEGELCVLRNGEIVLILESDDLRCPYTGVIEGTVYRAQGERGIVSFTDEEIDLPMSEGLARHTYSL